MINPWFFNDERCGVKISFFIPMVNFPVIEILGE
jgi:hypothetical protein